MRTPSTRHVMLLPAALALAAVAAVPAQAAVGPALTGPRPDSACSGSKGVTVVVDFTRLSGKVDTACDSGDPKTGLAALSGAGFSYAFVPRYPGFVCTIDQKPNPCNGAPAKAYWSYWHAQPHGKWTYSATGAGSYHPAQGSVQGWAFGAGQPPGITPP